MRHHLRRTTLGSILALLLSTSPACSAILGANDPIEIVEPGDGASAAADAPADGPAPDGSDGSPDRLLEGSSDGSGAQDTWSPPDSGPPPFDSSVPDLGPPDVGPPDGAPGAHLLTPPLKGVSVWGVTGDNWIVASDPGNVFQLPLSGGPPVVTMPTTPMTSLQVSGDAVFVWGPPQSAAPIAPLQIWDPGSGMPPPTATATSVPGIGASAANLVYYVAGAQQTADDGGTVTTGTLVVAPLGTPSTAIASFPNVLVDAAAVGPFAPRLVTTAAGVFFSVCTSATPSGCTIAEPSGNPIVSGVSPVWSVDPSGQTLIVALPAGGGEIVSAAGSVLTSFEVDGGVITSAEMSTSLGIYVTGTTLKSVSATSAPTLLAAPATAVSMISPQGDVCLYATMPPDPSGNADVWGVTTSGGLPPMLIAPAPARALAVGNTAPLVHVVAGLQNIAGASGVGSAWFSPWPLPGAPQPAQSLAGQSLVVRMNGLGRVVYDSNAALLPGPPYGYADLHVYSMAPSLNEVVATGANLIFAMTPGGDQIVFGWDTGPQGPGVYAFTMP